jgi:hypothetical protein
MFISLLILPLCINDAQITNQRLIDYVPMTIEHELCQALADNLQQALYKNLFGEPGLSQERKKDLVSEEPEIAERRQRLEEKKRRLVEIQQKLDGLPRRARLRAPPIVSSGKQDEEADSGTVHEDFEAPPTPCWESATDEYVFSFRSQHNLFRLQQPYYAKTAVARTKGKKKRRH